MSDFTERTTWRDTLTALLTRVREGDDVDPAELADTRAKADAEEEVEAARKSRHQRKREQEAREAAATRADELAAGIDPQVAESVTADLTDAWNRYLDAVDAAADRYAEHGAQVRDLASLAARAGAPVVDGFTQSDRNSRVTGDRVESGGSVTWRSVDYTRPTLDPKALPHNRPDRRRAEIDARRPRRT